MKKRFTFAFLGLVIPLHMLGQATVDNTVRFVNYGKMNVEANAAADAKASLYIPNSLSMIGSEISIVQNGITTLGGNFNNDVIAGNIFSTSSSGTFRFYGATTTPFQNIQQIRGTADRSFYYIDFPNVEVDKSDFYTEGKGAYVKVVPTMGISTKNLALTVGKIQLDSRLADQSGNLQTQVANMLVDGSVSYNTIIADRTQKGVVEVLLALPENQVDRKSRFIAFSSPFKRMYADYFSYWMLGAPTNTGLFGDSKNAISDPTYGLTSGRGHVVGQDVFDDEEEYYHNQVPYSTSRFSDRATNLLTLNRWADPFYASSINVAQKTGAVTNAYTEEIQTDDVVIQLQPGYNYLGNPYTVPLDISKLLLTNPDDISGVSDPWNISRSQVDGRPDNLYAAAWVMDQMVSTVTNAAQHKFKVDATWTIAQKIGNTTYDRNGEGVTMIAPMQLFVVWAEKASTITIPKSERKHGNINFLRNSNDPIVDELLLEVVDNDTQGYDRMCVVFRPDASLKAGDPYDAYKIFNKSGAVTQIYNHTDDGADMMVNVVPNDLKRMNINITPASQPKEVTLTAYRMNSLITPEGVWLHDLQERRVINLKKYESYTFQTTPTDPVDRFILHFANVPTAIDNPDQIASLFAYYKDGVLSVSGFSPIDEGSLLSVLDLQGRMVKSVPVSLNGSNLFTTPLPVQQGVYILKVTGKRTYTTKLICK